MIVKMLPLDQSTEIYHAYDSVFHDFAFIT